MNASRKVRVVIVDDSAFVRASIARLLVSDGRFEVVGQASEGRAALALIERERPDVATMDFQMPGMTGDRIVAALMETTRTPVVMLSAHTTAGAEATMAALAAGAVDVVAKPDGELSFELSKVSRELCDKLLEASRARPQQPIRRESQPSTQPLMRGSVPPEPRLSVAPPARVGRDHVVSDTKVADRLVVIGASTGGPSALEAILPTLTHAPFGIVIVQHIGPLLTQALAARLSAVMGQTVREARDGDRVRVSEVLVAPGGRHLSFVAGGMIRLLDDPLMHGVRPAVDVTLRSAATSFGGRTCGVILTGMGRDGAVGLASIKAAGGRTIAQDAATSVVYGMPRAAVELGVVDEVQPLGMIAAAIVRAVDRLR